MAATESQGTIIRRGDGGSPESFTAIGEIVSFSGPGGQATVIDVSNLADTAKAKLMGLKDEGSMTLSVNFDPSDSEQTSLRTDRTNRTERNFQLVFNDTSSTRFDFAAFVLGFVVNGSVDDKVSADITLEITGDITETTD